jgi:hypothetical protein
LTDLAALPPALATGMEKTRKLSAQDESGPLPIDRFESGAEPTTDGVLVYLKEHRSLAHAVVPVELHAPRIETLHRIEPVSMRARISSTRQAVMRGPSFTGFG